MSVGDYTASNINMEEDKKEELKKTGTVDMAKLQVRVSVRAETVCATAQQGLTPSGLMSPLIRLCLRLQADIAAQVELAKQVRSTRAPLRYS